MILLHLGIKSHQSAVINVLKYTYLTGQLDIILCFNTHGTYILHHTCINVEL